MSYTIGIKRRFWPGYTRHTVKSHDWQNFRFILDLEDGGQIHIPGFQAGALKVYPDFWTHLQNLKAQLAYQRPAAPPPPVQYTQEAPAPRAEPIQAKPSDMESEAYRRAVERVNSLFGSNGAATQSGPGPLPS